MRLPLLQTPAAPPPHFDTGPRSISAVKMLRISITDRCNFRCLYCMPEEGVRWLPKDDILTFEEIEEVVRAAIELHDIRRFKLTGGEPTVRHGLVDLVHRLRRIPGIEDLSLTTNGLLLPDLARPLKQGGLDRVTVSLDSLDPSRFKRITRTGDLPTVLRGLDALEAASFTGTKINCVAMRHTNDDEFPAFARLTLTRPLTVRFIEYMPLGDAALQGTGFKVQGSVNSPSPLGGEGRVRGDVTSEKRLSEADQSAIRNPQSAIPPRISNDELGPAGGCGAQDRGNAFISEPEIRDRIEQSCGPLTPLDRSTEPGVGPANVYRLSKGNPKGRIGFISAMSAPFCSTCNRLRLTANGILRSCLFEGGEVNLRPILRTPTDPSARRTLLAAAMTDCVRLKPDVHSHHGNEQMSRIGG
jgi:cyclic pyranopterin phosphate synthase